MLNIIGHRKIYLSIALILVGAAVSSVAVFKFREGIDFTGGTLWQFRLGNESPAISNIETHLKDLKIENARVTVDQSNNTYLARLPIIDEPAHRALLSDFKKQYSEFEELSFQSIGPSVSAGLRKNAITALVLVLVGISLYIAWAFRKVSRPVSSWKYGFITLITLFHDVSIPAGLLAVLGYFGKVEIDTNFIVALLVVMGFSVHDTIVVFDRVRENLTLDRTKYDFNEVINRSVNQTLARSINTSLTLILVLIALYVTGPAHLKYFILTLLVGTITGIYSSVFVASPALVLAKPKDQK